MENRENLFKQYKKDWPQTVGETDKVFDNDNFIDWLCQQTKALTDEIEELKRRICYWNELHNELVKENQQLQSRIGELEKGNEKCNHNEHVYNNGILSCLNCGIIIIKN